MDRLPLAGKTVLVAGTGPGIGTGIALALAGAGARVACVDMDARHARCCADDVVAAGGEAVAVVGDVSDEAGVANVVRETESAFGPVDVLVNGVAVFDERSVLEMDYAGFLRHLTVVLGSAFLLTRAVASGLIHHRRTGSLIHLASTAGHQGQADNIGYCTAKAGLLNFTRSAAAELGRFGIRVNTLTPTATDPREGKERAARWGLPIGGIGLSLRQETNRRRLPLELLPTPAHYGQAVVFLASDASEMVSGTDLRVDAGALATYWAWSAGDHRTGYRATARPDDPEGDDRDGSRHDRDQ